MTRTIYTSHILTSFLCDILILSLFLINIYVLRSVLFGIILFTLYLFYVGIRFSNIFFRSVLTSDVLLGVFMTISIMIISGSLLFIMKLLNLTNIIIILSLILFISFIISINHGVYNDIFLYYFTLNKINLKVNIEYIIFFIYTIISLLMLAMVRTGQKIVNVWEVVPPVFWVVFIFLFYFLIYFTIKKIITRLKCYMFLQSPF